MSRVASTSLLRELAPEPAHCWIRHAPVRWPGPARPWLDLASGRLGECGGEPDLLAALEGVRLGELLYLPPVEPELAAARDRLAARQAARGTPVLVQLLPGDTISLAHAGVVVVWDLLPLALAEEIDPSTALAASSPPADAAVWPLVAGVGDGARWTLVASALATAGVPALLGAPLELSGRDRRALGETMSEARYLRLFHGEAPPPVALARVAARYGLLPLLPRPLPRPPLVGAGNLRMAAALAGCAELCLWLGEPESRAQELLRAARFAERATPDLAALAREGNLTVLPWLAGEPRQLVAEVAAGDEPRLWRQLLERLAAT